MTSESDLEKGDDEDDVDNEHLFDATRNQRDIRYILQKFPTFELNHYNIYNSSRLFQIFFLNCFFSCCNNYNNFYIY